MRTHVQFLHIGLAVLPLTRPALHWNAGRDFKANEYPNSPRELLNPNGTVTNWSYGSRLSATWMVLNLYTTNQHLNSASGTTNLPGWILQESLNLSPADWTNFPSGATNPVTIPATLPTKLYRLFKP